MSILILIFVSVTAMMYSMSNLSASFMEIQSLMIQQEQENMLYSLKAVSHYLVEEGYTDFRVHNSEYVPLKTRDGRYIMYNVTGPNVDEKIEAISKNVLGDFTIESKDGLTEKHVVLEVNLFDPTKYSQVDSNLISTDGELFNGLNYVTDREVKMMSGDLVYDTTKEIIRVGEEEISEIGEEEAGG